jgi:dihydroflavonol-4-reductase
MFMESHLTSEAAHSVDVLTPDDGVVLVTGGAGFIGSALVDVLHHGRFAVRVMELPGVDASHLPHGVEVVRGDVTCAADVARAVSGCAAVVHLAGNPNLYHADADAFDRVNHQGTRRVLEAAGEAGVKRIVHCSTESILASPDADAVVREDAALDVSQMFGPYLRSKWLAEAAAREAAAAGLPVVIVTPSVPVGPGDRAGGPLTRLIAEVLRGRIRGMLPGTINVIDVRDLATAIGHALTRGSVGERYLLAGHNLTYPELFDAIAAVSGATAPQWIVPYPLALAFAFVEEWWCRHVTGGTPTATVTGVRLTRRSFRFDAAQSREALGWPLRPLEQSLCDAVAWLVERGELPDTLQLTADAGVE